MNRAGSMRRELAACGAMACQAFQMRANQGSNWLTWVFVGLTLLVPVLGFAMSAPPAVVIGAGAGIPLAFLATLWWMMLVAALVQQRSHTARLVPGSGRRAVIVMLVAAALITAVLTLLLAMAFGAALVVSTLVVLALGASAAWVTLPSFRVVYPVLLIVQFFFGTKLVALLPFSLAEQVVIFGPVLILGLGYAALRTLYRGLPKQATLSDLLRGRTVEAGGGMPPALARQFRRDCAEGRIAALLMHAVGPLGRTPSLAKFALAATIVPALMYAAPGWVENYRTILRVVIPAFVVGLQLLVVSTMVQAVYKTRREQALVRLASRAPGALALNAALARALLQRYGWCWLGSTLLALLSLYFLGVSDAVLLRMLAVFLLMLTLGNALLRDYASERGANGSALARLLVTLLGCGLVLGSPVPFFLPGPWFVVGGVLAAGLAFGWLRWHRMLRAPAAFPAARTR